MDGQETIEELLNTAVSQWIQHIKDRNGPNQEDIERCTYISDILGEYGDILLYGNSNKTSKKKSNGEEITQDDLFNILAEGIAILSFVEGGVEIFGYRYTSENGVEKIDKD